MATLPMLNIDWTSYYPIILVVLSIVFFVGISVLVLFFIYRYARYKAFICYIWEFNDEGYLINVRKDKAGIFYDVRTHSKLLYLLKAKVGLRPDRIPYFYQDNQKIVYIVRLGEKNYHLINPKIKGDKISLSVGEEDVNWAEDEYKRAVEAVSTPDRLMQILPYIVWALVIIGTLILMIQILKKVDVIKDVMLTAKDIAVANAQAKTGTVVMP